MSAIDDLLGPPPDKAPSKIDALLSDPAPAQPVATPGAISALGSTVSDVMDAFGVGFKNAWGGDKLGLSDQTMQALRDFGTFSKDPGTSSDFMKTLKDPIRSFNESWMAPLAAVADAAYRLPRSLVGGLVGGVRAVSPDAAKTIESGIDVATDPGLYESLQGLGPAGTIAGGAGWALRKLLPARDLGVIGDKTLSIADGTPAEAAARVTEPPVTPGGPIPPTAPKPGPVPTAAASVPQDTLQGEAGAVDKAGNIRLDLIDTHEDAKNVIRQAAIDNGGYTEARQGNITLSQVDGLSQASGIPPEELNLKGIGRRLRNDDEVRVAIQSMIQSADNVSELMKKAALTDDPADLIAFQEARMRHSVIQEQVSGLTAEWGRTGNVFQEFSDNVKDAQSLGRFLKDKKGESIDDLRAMVKAGSELDPRTELPRFMQDSRKPDFFDKFLYYWKNGLLSGPFTHTAYAMSNALFSGYDAAVVTPVASAIGAARQILPGADAERVMIGEGPARLWGLVSSVPDALLATGRALRSGLPEALPGQKVIAGAADAGEPQGFLDRWMGVPQPMATKTAIGQTKPIGGAVGTVVGLPERVISGIHTFYNFLGYGSEIEAQAYRQAASEGLSPFSGDFWARKSAISAAPTPDMMQAGIDNGARATFTTELGPKGKALQSFSNKVRAVQLIVPFQRTPMDIYKTALEGSPAAFVDSEMRANLLGQNGAVARDTQWARLAAGSAIGALAVNWAANGLITGGGPSDPTARAEWMLTHKPYSIKLGGTWYDYRRMGSIGIMLGLGADMHDIGGAVSDADYAGAAGRVAKAGSNAVLDQSFMTGMADLVQAIKDPDREMARYLTKQAGTLIPFSTGVSQVASAMDPDMRQAKDFVSALKERVPGLRQTLMPVRDYAGRPVQNDRYGAGAIIGQRPVNTDPVDQEMERLQVRPAPPQPEIKGVKLDPKQYDDYQVYGGVLAKSMLDNIVKSPGWDQLPSFAQKEMMQSSIRTARQMAEPRVQIESEINGTPDKPGLITQGLRQTIQRITGKPASP